MKKNYTDSTQAFLYALGCSLVHMTFFLTSFFVKRVDMDQAKMLEEEWMASQEQPLNEDLLKYSTYCSSTAGLFEGDQDLNNFLHLVCFFVCL